MRAWIVATVKSDILYHLEQMPALDWTTWDNGFIGVPGPPHILWSFDSGSTWIATGMPALDSGQTGTMATISGFLGGGGLDNDSGKTFNWYVTAGTITAGAGTNTITFDAATTATGTHLQLEIGASVTNLLDKTSGMALVNNLIFPALTTPTLDVPATVTSGQANVTVSWLDPGFPGGDWPVTPYFIITLINGTLDDGFNGTGLTCSVTVGTSGTVSYTVTAHDGFGRTKSDTASSTIV